MLEFQSVTRLAGREAVLERASLVFSRDAPTAVLGLSREARPAFLRLAGGMDAPASGHVKLDGQLKRPRRGKTAGYAWINREGAAPSSKTVSRVLEQAGGRKPTSSALGDLARRVGLEGELHLRTRDLSPAQRIRLAIGCARAAKPALILLDAPLADVMGGARASLLADLPALLADTGAVVILAAARPEEALALGGDVVILWRGRVTQAGGAAEVFAHPKDLRALLATAEPAPNLLPAIVEHGHCRLGDGSTFSPPQGVSLPNAGRCTFAFRPGDLHFDRRSEEAARFAVRAQGETSEDGQRYLRLGFAGEAWLAPIEPGASPSQEGILLNAFIERSRLLVFDEAGQAIA